MVYTKTHRESGKRQVRIQTNVPGSTLIEEDAATKAAARLESEGKASMPWGSPPVTGDRDGDVRFVEYRLHQRGGKPTRLTITVVLRDRHGKAKPAETLDVPWPW